MEVYKAIEKAFALPSLVLQVFCREGTLASFTSEKNFGEFQLELDMKDDVMIFFAGLAVGTEPWPSGSSVVAYNPQHRITSVAFHAGGSVSFDFVLEQLEWLEGAVFIPTAFHFIQLQLQFSAMHKEYHTHLNKLNAISTSLDLEPFTDPESLEESSREFFDYTEATKELTMLRPTITSQIVDARAIQDAIVAVLDMHQKLQERASEDEWRSMSSDWMIIRDCLLHLSNRVKILEQRLEIDASTAKVTSATVSIQPSA